MTAVTIIGAGNMAASIAGLAKNAGASVQILARDADKAAQVAASVGGISASIGDAIAGDIVVLAVPYGAVADVLAPYAGALAGKAVVDITNPVDFTTFDGLVVDADSSAAQAIQAAHPDAHVVKAFNTNFGPTLAAGKVGGQGVAVLVATDSADARDAVQGLVTQGGLRAIDAGALKRARELEALGFLQITLAAGEKTGWDAGFALA